MISVNEQIRRLILYMERSDRVMNLIRLQAPPVVLSQEVKLVGEAAAWLHREALTGDDATKAIKIAYEMYLDQGEDEDED